MSNTAYFLWVGCTLPDLARVSILSAAEAGFHSVTTVLSEDVSEAELLRTVQDLNANPLIDGILVQLPLPEHIDQKLILESIEVAK